MDTFALQRGVTGGWALILDWIIHELSVSDDQTYRDRYKMVFP